MLIKCPECKKKISDQCGKCPNCGYPIEIPETPIEALDNEIIENKVAVEEKTDNLQKERKTINKKMLIGIISAAVVLLTVGGILAYNALLPRINATKDFKAAVKFVEQKNTELEKEISQSEKLIAKKQPLLDETLISTLENAISDAKSVKITDFNTPKKVMDIISRTEELNKTNYSQAIANLNDKHNALEINAKRYQLVNVPTEAYVIQCLKTIPEITGISAVTEKNDPNGNLNKEGGYTATVYFSHKSVNQKDVYGDNLIDKGTDAGGAIEVYTCVEDATKRRDYLAAFDGGILASGTHTVIGTVLVRTSNELSASQQKKLETKIIAALTYIEEIDGKKEATIDKKSKTKKNTDAKSNENKPSTTSSNKQTTSTSKNQQAVKDAEEIADFYATVFPKMVKEILMDDYGYSETQANYGVKNANIDWNFYAVIHLEEYFDINEGKITKSEAKSYLGAEKGYSDATIKYALSKANIDWNKSSNSSSSSKTSSKTSRPKNNRNADAIEKARWIAYYDYNLTPLDVQKILVDEEGFSNEDAKYCISKVDNEALEGSYYNWVERVENYVLYEMQDYYIEYTWCYDCEEVYGVHNICPICGAGAQPGQEAFGYTKAEVINKLKEQGFSDEDIQNGLKKIPSDKYYDEKKYKKP